MIKTLKSLKHDTNKKNVKSFFTSVIDWDSVESSRSRPSYHFLEQTGPDQTGI